MCGHISNGNTLSNPLYYGPQHNQAGIQNYTRGIQDTNQYVLRRQQWYYVLQIQNEQAWQTAHDKEKEGIIYNLKPEQTTATICLDKNDAHRTSCHLYA